MSYFGGQKHLNLQEIKVRIKNPTRMDTIKIGKDLTVKRIGLGTNRIRNDEVSKISLLKALELGINFFDTASAYTNGESEEVIGNIFYPHYQDKNIVISTKGGMKRGSFAVDSSPQNLSISLENSLRKLKLERIDLYFLHRVDPFVPLEQSLLFLKKMQDEGKIRYIGLSAVSVEQIRQARKLVEVVVIQNEYNFWERRHDEVINYCERENLVFIPYFPLRGSLLQEPAEFAFLQKKYRASFPQLALAWLLQRSPCMLPIPGSLSPTHIAQNINSLKIKLEKEDFDKLSDFSQ